MHVALEVVVHPVCRVWRGETKSIAFSTGGPQRIFAMTLFSDKSFCSKTVIFSKSVEESRRVSKSEKQTGTEGS